MENLECVRDRVHTPIESRVLQKVSNILSDSFKVKPQSFDLLSNKETFLKAECDVTSTPSSEIHHALSGSSKDRVKDWPDVFSKEKVHDGVVLLFVEKTHHIDLSFLTPVPGNVNDVILIRRVQSVVGSDVVRLGFGIGILLELL